MVALAPPLAPAAAASPDEISELVSRGLSAATLLTEVAEVSVAEAKELQRSVADAVRSAPASASTSGSVMRNFELHLDNKLDSLETQTALVTKPLVKQRKVWGGAHAVERGSTRPVPLPSAPKADWWLAHADDDDGGYVELDEAAAKEERQRLGRGGGAGSPRSPRRSPRAKRSQSVPPIEQPSSPPPLQASPSHHHVGAATLHAKQPALPSHASGQGRSAHKRVKPLNQRQGQRTTMANAPYTPEPWGAETPLSRPLTPLDHDLRRSASASMLTNRGASVTASPNAPNARSSLQGRISPQREGVAPTRSGRISPSIDRAPSVFDSGAQARFSFVPQQKSLRNPSM